MQCAMVKKLYSRSKASESWQSVNFFPELNEPARPAAARPVSHDAGGQAVDESAARTQRRGRDRRKPTNRRPSSVDSEQNRRAALIFEKMPERPLRVFVTGASGYLGQFLLDALLLASRTNDFFPAGTYSTIPDGIAEGSYY